MINSTKRVAIITGASGGIGKEITYLLAKNGINVTLTGRRIDKLEEIAHDLEKIGISSCVVSANLEEEEEIKNIFKISHDYWGKTDILINCAGLIINANFSHGNSINWKKMWNVNVHAPCVAIQEFLKFFNNNDGGQIVNISSMSAHRIITAGSIYPATKFAIKAISESLRKELIQNGTNVRVSCISPGLVDTNFGRTNINNSQKHLLPVDIANAVLYILNTPLHVAIHDILLKSNIQFD